MADRRDSDDTQRTGAASGEQREKESGQPIGGNDSAIGTGTTLTQGAEFRDDSDENRSGGDASGGAFVGSQADGSASGPTRASAADATGGTDFANQGRGATDEEEPQD